MVSVNNIETLLGNANLLEVENAIANKIGCDVYRNDLPLLAGFIKEEIDSSKLSITDIIRFIENHSESIIEFGQLLLNKSKPQSLSAGVAISYSIYMIYLKYKGEKELLEYLKRRRIPKPQMLLEQLLSIKEKMNL